MYDCHAYTVQDSNTMLHCMVMVIAGETCFSLHVQGKNANAKMCILHTLIHVYYNQHRRPTNGCKRKAFYI